MAVYGSESESDAEGGQHHSTDHDPQQHQPNQQQLQHCQHPNWEKHFNHQPKTL
jgi:hypothetical protein